MAAPSDPSTMADPYALPPAGKLDTGSLGPAFGGSLSFENANPGPTVQPDFLFPENDYNEDFRRSWGERLTFHIGGAYLTGLMAGGGYGLFEGLKASAGERRRIRINSVLNAMGKRGPGLGNGLGCIAMMWSIFETIAYTAREKDDLLNPIGAGVLTGGIYSSLRGPKMAAATGLGLGALAAAGSVVTKQGLLKGKFL